MKLGDNITFLDNFLQIKFEKRE